jgi:hypothetical protein
MPWKLRLMLIIPKFKKGGIPINRETHACQRSRNTHTPFEAQGFPKVPPKRVQNISFLRKSSTSCQEHWYLHPVPFHKIQESIKCLWFFPNACFGLLYHTLYYTPSSACFVGVWNPFYHGSWSRNLHVFFAYKKNPKQ